MTVTVVDARGLKCPLPALKLRREAKAGMILEMIADDPAAAVDVPALAREMGWAIEEIGALRWRIAIPA